MKQVRERLYIGDIEDAEAVLASKQTPITHVLNLIPPAQKLSHGRKVAPYPVHDPRVEEASSSGSDAPETVSANGSAPRIVCMNVPLRDVDTQNLLDNLEVCLEFIETGLASGAVLVHCFAGVSRSAAVVIAYLMKSERLKLEDAHKSLKDVSSGVCPNLGFWQQLNMFQEMGFVIDRQSPTYKKFRLENLGEAHAKGARVEPSSCAPDPGASAGELLLNGEHADSTTLRDDSNGSETKPFTVYRCKKCRRLVASKSNVIVHESGSGVFYLNLRKRVKKPGDDVSMPLCSSIFVEPIQWMHPVFEEGAASGKLNCANCQAKLGNFNWAGMQCSCGAWVNPAFQLHKSSMDASWL